MTNEILFPALFIFAMTLILFTYAGYPALMFAISRLSLALAFVANSLALGAGHFYQYAFFAQLLFYFAAFIGWLGDRSGVRLGPFVLPYYFVLVNAAAPVAFLKFMRGETHVVWEPLRDSPQAESAGVSKPNLAQGD